MERKIDWSKITDNVAVNCRTEEEAEMFVKAVCEKYPENEHMWRNSSQWFQMEENTCYNLTDNRLTIDNKEWFADNRFTILPFSDILIQEPERDQTAKADKGKLMLELIPPETYIALGEILTYGANKYAPENWKTVEPERYVGALLRHLTAYMMDPSSIDEESGFSHIKHVLCNAMFLEWFEEQNNRG